MLTLAVATLIVFVFTTVLTIAGVGAAFIIVPVFYWLGVPLTEAMATALLLNALSMAAASVTFVRRRLVAFRAAIPIILVATTLSPLGAFCTRYVSRNVLLWLFVGFLAFAGAMMLFYRPAPRPYRATPAQQVALGAGVGSAAGFFGGLLGVGGGNFIVPALVFLGFEAKRAAATTAFIVIFSSLAGFLGHAAMGHVNAALLAVSAIGSVLGAVVGAHLAVERLKSAQVKRVIGIVLWLIAAKMLWGLV